MTLSERLRELVRAAFSGIYVQSFEHQDAIAEIAQLCRREHWTLSTWDIDQGLTLDGRTVGEATAATTDPLAAIRSFNALASPEGTAILVLKNFHRFLSSVEIVQAIDAQIHAGKQNRTFVVILAPVIQIPLELEKLFVLVDHDLPDRQQIEAIARSLAIESGELPEGPELSAVLDAAAGLTRMEVENALSLALVRQGRITSDVIWELKMQSLRKTGLLEMHRGTDSLAGLGGLEAMKSFCLRALRSRSERVETRGTSILGVPGTCMSEFAKHRGVSAGQFSLPSSYRANHPGELYLISPLKNITKISPEVTHAERLDSIFFVDLPAAAENQANWKIHPSYFSLDYDLRHPRDNDWTEDEIRACCRFAPLLYIHLVEAVIQIDPVAVTARESIKRFRSWAAGRCLAADRPSLYQMPVVSDQFARGLHRVNPYNN